MKKQKIYEQSILMGFLSVIFLLLLSITVQAAPLGTIVFQDTFTVDGVERQYGGTLNATTVEGAMVDWKAPGGLVFTDISGEDVVSANAQSNSALIDADLALIGGTVKIEADVMPLGTAADDPDRTDWVALGFQPGNTSTDHGGAGLWMLFRGNGGYQIFQNGTSTQYGDGSIDGYVQGQIVNMSITYDSAADTATFMIDDEVILSQDMAGTGFLEAQKRPFIIIYDGGQYFDNFTVSMDGGVLPPMTNLQSPADNAVQVEVNPEMSWTLVFPIDQALTYDVYLDPNETYVTDLDPSALVSSQQSGLSYVPESPLDHETTYFWRVVPYVDGELDESSASGIHSFITKPEVQKWFDTAWMSDDDLDLSAGKVYTHKVKFNAASEDFATTVLGIDFENDNGRMGSDWSLLGAPNAHTGSQFTGTGEGVALNTRFFYGSPSILNMTGLTPGVEYRTTLYTHGWGDAGGRVIAVTTSDDEKTQYLDENIDGNGLGRLFMYYYTAPESGELSIEFVEVADNASWHHYSFTNEEATDIYLDPTPMPDVQLDAELDLSWELNGDVLNPTYNLYLSNDSNSLDLEISDLDQATYHVSLDPEKHYYWKIQVVEDGGPVVHESPVWNFFTSPPPDAEKVLEWKMDETEGSIAQQTGTSDDADGILMGFNDPNGSTMFVPGLVGNALLLNGTSEYLDVDDASPYLPTGDEQAFAVSAYFKTYKQYGPIFSMRNSQDGTPLIDITIGHDGAYESAGRVKMLVRDDNGNLGPNTNSGILVNDGRWHSLVVMRSEGNWTMYVDGIERAKATGVASASVTLDWLAIGAEKRWVFDTYGSWTGSRTELRYFEGMIDEVCVWSGEMRAHQIQEHAALIPPQGDLDFDFSVDADDLTILAENWLNDSYIPVQDSVVLEDMESYNPSDAGTYEPYWEGLQGGVSLRMYMAT